MSIDDLETVCVGPGASMPERLWRRVSIQNDALAEIGLCVLTMEKANLTWAERWERLKICYRDCVLSLQDDERNDPVYRTFGQFSEDEHAKMNGQMLRGMRAKA